MAKKRVSPKRTKPSGSLRCPDCGFKAAHAMGLGRHRSARHGVASKRSKMQRTGTGWLTRQEAARRARVHYNTIRTWERSGLVRSRKVGREVMIDAKSLARASGAGATAGSAADVAEVLTELERFYAELSAGLKRLLDAADASRAALSKNGKSKKRR
jgi:hypothetical protein